MILKHYNDIRVAVGSEERLVVLVLRDADRLSITESITRRAGILAVMFARKEIFDGR